MFDLALVAVHLNDVMATLGEAQLVGAASAIFVPSAYLVLF